MSLGPRKERFPGLGFAGSSLEGFEFFLFAINSL
jgi:hypothetical protein